MTPRMKLMLASVAMMAACAEGSFGYNDNSSSNPMQYPEGNAHKRCHRPECNNYRSGNGLYCSAQCCKIDKQRVKQLKARS